MAVNYWKAKQDRPGFPYVGSCLPGRFPQRWLVLWATEITLCELLQYDTGILLKWQDLSYNIFPKYLQYRYFSQGFDPNPPCRAFRRPGNSQNDWLLTIGSFFKRLEVTIPQPLDEQLLISGSSDDVTVVGSWDDPNPVGAIGFSTYATQALALAAWPDAVDWTWGP